MEEKEVVHNIASTDSNMDLINIAAGNQNIKTKIALLLSIIESKDINNIENQVIALLKNMLNFFSNYVDELPHFESLTLEQQKAYLIKFKSVALNITGNKIKSIDEMVQVFVFTILRTLKENIKPPTSISTNKLQDKDANSEFRNILKQAASNEIYKLATIKAEENNFIKEITVNSEILNEVKTAMSDAGLNFDTQYISTNSLRILNAIQYNLKNSPQIGKRIY
jgi:hypothetical protein